MTKQKKEWRYGELCSPKTDQEYKEIGNSFLDQMERRIVSNSWSNISNKKGVVLESQEVEGSSIHILRCTKHFEGVKKFDQFVEKIFDSSFEVKKQTCDEMLEHVVVEEIDEYHHVILTRFEAPRTFTSREFLLLKSKKVFEDGSCLITTCSINRKKTPFGEGFIRATCNSGIMIKPLKEDNKIAVTKVDHIDPKGKVPSFVLNMLKKKSVENLVKMEAYLE